MRIDYRTGTNARVVAIAASLLLSIACAHGFGSGPSADEARSFIEDANTQLEALGVRSARAEWVKSNFITVDTEAIAAEANENYVTANVELAKQASLDVYDG